MKKLFYFSIFTFLYKSYDMLKVYALTKMCCLNNTYMTC